jgi:hypothetical protein
MQAADAGDDREHRGPQRHASHALLLSHETIGFGFGSRLIDGTDNVTGIPVHEKSVPPTRHRP